MSVSVSVGGGGKWLGEARWWGESVGEVGLSQVGVVRTCFTHHALRSSLERERLQNVTVAFDAHLYARGFDIIFQAGTCR